MSRIQLFLPTLVQAIIISSLHHCSNLLKHPPVSITAPYLNTAIRDIISKHVRSCPSSVQNTAMAPISLGLKAKALTMVYKVLGALAPFFSDLICYYSLLCSFCSCTSQRWAFTLAVATTLNTLPPNIHIPPLMKKLALTSRFKIVIHFQPWHSLSLLLCFTFSFHP